MSEVRKKSDEEQISPSEQKENGEVGLFRPTRTKMKIAGGS